MRYSTAILAFAAAAMAAPFESMTFVCPAGLYSSPQCCATDVLGVVGLNCAVPPTAPTDANNFISTCASKGQQAKCCVVPVAGQDLLCQDVSPSAGGGGSPTPKPTPTKAPGGGASSTPCESSTPAPAPPAASSTGCGC